MNPPRLSDLPGVARLAVGLFVVLLFLFQVTAQANLWVRDGGGSLPTPEQVLAKYHGRPDGSRLHRVLDPAVKETDPRCMWKFLGDSATEQAANRAIVLGWVERGAPESGWAEVAPVFTGTATCGQCHLPGGVRQDLPFETWEQVREVAQPDRGMPWSPLLVSAHNHVFAFAVLALLLSLGVAFAPGLGRWRVLPVLGAFVGAALDVGSWFLTKALGSPFHLGVLLGGGLFGASTALMGLLVLEETWLSGRVLAALAGRFRRKGDAT